MQKLSIEFNGSIELFEAYISFNVLFKFIGWAYP